MSLSKTPQNQRRKLKRSIFWHNGVYYKNNKREKGDSIKVQIERENKLYFHFPTVVSERGRDSKGVEVEGEGEM